MLAIKDIQKIMPNIKYREYLWHLWHENKTEQDLSWEEHTHWNGYVWSDTEVIKYYSIFRHKDIIQDKKIVDVGSFFHQPSDFIHNKVKSYTGLNIDTRIEDLWNLGCKIMSSNIPCKFIVADGETYDLASMDCDTICSLGVFYQVENPKKFIHNLSQSSANNLIFQSRFHNESLANTQGLPDKWNGRVLTVWNKQDIISEIEKYWKITSVDVYDKKDLHNIGAK